MAGMLDIISVSKSFGGVRAVDNVSISLATGETVALIGPNGSGKTTLLNILCGFHAPDVGSISLQGVAIQGFKPERIARRGLVRMFQMTRLFAQLSAYDNLLTAGLAQNLSLGASRQRALAMLAELKLEPVRSSQASALSGGQRKLLEFGMCFMAQPKIALLDEPFSAIHPTMKEVMAGFVRRRRAEGQAILLVSHDMPVVAELCPRTVCMNAGAVLADGPTGDVLRHHDVIEAYLGEASK